MLYLCANKPSTRQLLKQSQCLRSFRPLTQFSCTDIKLLSKALIARLIPIDAANDDMATLIQIKDDEVDHLISTLNSARSEYIIFPIIPVVMDLSRSSHNMWAFASKDIALMLSDTMDNISENYQATVAQLIWSLMEFNFEGSKEASAVVNNGTLISANEDVMSIKEGRWFCIVI